MLALRTLRRRHTRLDAARCAGLLNHAPFLQWHGRTSWSHGSNVGAIVGVPIVPVLGLGSVVLMMTQLEPLAIIGGTVACGVGARDRMAATVA